MEDRLQKILAHWGIASRRQAEQWIADGRVRVNGTLAHLGQKANPEIDVIEVDGTVVQPDDQPEPIYLLLNKPPGVLSTCHDPWNRPTVLDLLPAHYQTAQGLHPVGRLDSDSTGALLLTNQGALTFCLTHPRHHIPKTYRVWVQGIPPKSVLQAWRQGVWLEGRLTLPAQVRLVHRQVEPEPQAELEIILTEGRNRQIRRVADQLGHPVRQLHRTAIGPIQLKPNHGPELPLGHYRCLKVAELDFLRNMMGIIIDSGNMPVDIARSGKYEHAQL